MKKKEVVGKAVHLTATAVFLVLSIIALAAFSVMLVEFIGANISKGDADGTGEQLSAGLSAAFALVFMIIFGLADLVISVIGITLSSTVIRFRKDGARVFGIVATVINAVSVAVVVIASAVAFLVV